ncbi:MAG: hypothetical protein CMJ58_22760 [Planctomycetaceae bacterium]|nr:hypothetical protein [Planctomycetaceae bacterium]
MPSSAARLVATLVACWAALLSSAQAAPWSPLPVGTDVAVRTAAGRVLHGRIDARSDEQTLWLVAEAAGIAITSTTPASEVIEVTAAERVALAPLWSEVAETTPPAPSAASPALPDRVVVRSLEVAAGVANWDADPQIDGLELCLSPRGEHGEAIGIGGIVRVELHVETGGKWPSNRRFAIAERWQVEVAAEEFGPDGAVVRLPFERLQPELRSEFPPLGVLQVRYLVPGEGVVDATISDLPLAPPSFNRDRSELLTGSRRLPGETRPTRQ